jgi:quinol monooxygenase YgiN
MVIVIARFRVRPDSHDDVVALLTEVEQASRAEATCLNYAYYEAVAEPNAFVAVEEWRDMAALEEHLRTPHVAKLLAEVPKVVVEAPDIVAHEVAGSGPLPLPG